MFSPIEIGTRISSARSIKSMTLEEVASKVGVAKSTIMRYEKGTIEKIKLPVIESIAHALDVDPNWLIGNTDTPYSSQQNEPVTTEDGNGLDSELLKRLMSLTPDEAAKVDAFVQGLLASRSGKTSLPETKRQ